MFETHDNAKLSLPCSAGTHYWSYVLVALNIPIYVVEYQVTEGRGAIRQTAQLTDAAQLNALAKTKNVTVLTLSLLSPAQLNGTDDWKLEPLVEVCELFDKRKPDENGEYAYHLKNGKQYLYNPFGKRHSELGGIRSLFKMQ